jgi:hypothetical protein
MLMQLGYLEEIKKSPIKIPKLLRCKSTAKTRNGNEEPLSAVITVDNLLSSYLKSSTELES